MLEPTFCTSFKFYADDAACEKICALWKMVLALFSVPFDDDHKVREKSVEEIVAAFKNKTLSLNIDAHASRPHVTDSEAAAFYKEQFWLLVGATNPDLVLVKFINARPKSLTDAFRMLVECLVWRGHKMCIAELMRRGDAAFPQRLVSKGQVFFRGYDFENRLIVRINAGLHRKADQTVDEFHRFVVYTIESARLLLHRDSNACITILFDVADFSIANLDLGSMKFLIGTLSAYYPESLGSCLIINYPITLFGIYKLIQSFLDANMQKKIKFIKTKELQKHIPRKYIPVKYGGTDDDAFCYVAPRSDMPAESPEDAEFDAIRRGLIDGVIRETMRALAEPDAGRLADLTRIESVVKLRAIGTEHLFRRYAETHYHRSNVLTDRGRIVNWTPIGGKLDDQQPDALQAAPQPQTPFQ